MNISIPRPANFFRRPVPAAARPRPRSRAMGTGYGNSSGYVRRSYARSTMGPRFRMA